ncbi:hypothetical protein HDV06_003227, partial [Boothiomyces sp. JEL0866]
MLKSRIEAIKRLSPDLKIKSKALPESKAKGAVSRERKPVASSTKSSNSTKSIAPKKNAEQQPGNNPKQSARGTAKPVAKGSVDNASCKIPSKEKQNTAYKKENPKVSEVSVAVDTQPITISTTSFPKSLEARLGLAKVCTAIVTHNSLEFINLNDEQKISLNEAVRYYKEVIDMDPSYLDAYIELGNLLMQLKEEEHALEIYLSFPFKSTICQDELYLHSEINRLLIKQKKYKHPSLLKSLVMEGKAGGIKSISKYVDVLDAAGEYKILMTLYSAVSGKSEADSDL